MIDLKLAENILAQAQAAYNALKQARASEEFAQLMAKGTDLVNQAKEMADDVTEIALLTMQVYDTYLKPQARAIVQPLETVDDVHTRGDLVDFIVHQVRLSEMAA